MTDRTDLLIQLAESTSLDAALAAVEGLIASGCRWRNVGDDPNNYGRVNMGSDPGLALVERVTNALDAMLELEAVKSGTEVLPETPREAAELWFGVPGGRLSLVDLPSRQEMAKNVELRMLPGRSKRTPVIEIR